MEKIIKNCWRVKECNDGINRREKEKETEHFRAILGFKEHKIRLTKEYSTKLKIKKIFPNEKIGEQYKGSVYYNNLAFPVHKLDLEIDEGGHIDRAEAEEKEIQKVIDKETGFKNITFNPDTEYFNIFAEISKTQNYIVESTKKITKKLKIVDVKNFLKAVSKFSNNGTISRLRKSFARHLLPAIKKTKLRTYCLAGREHTNNIGSKTVTMKNKVISDKSRYAECFSEKSRFIKQKHNIRSGH